MSSVVLANIPEWEYHHHTNTKEYQNLENNLIIMANPEKDTLEYLKILKL